MASFGGQQQQDYGSSSQQQQPQQQRQSRHGIINAQTGLPMEFHEQLTPQEVETMTTIRRNASVFRTTGGVLGASVAGVYMLRKKRSLLSFRYFMGCFGGSLLGSWLCVPIGVVWSTSMVKKVDNPDHLIGVLNNVQKARMNPPLSEGGPEPFPRPGRQVQRPASQDGMPSMDPAGPSSMSSSSYPPAPTPPPTRTSARSRGAQTNQWGDEINAPDMPSYSTPSPPSATPSYQYNTPSNQPAPGQSGMSDAEADNANQGQSRWAQLRGQRQVQESSWEKIRQENARNAYNRQAAGGQGRPDQAAYSQGHDYAGQSGGATMADPSFGKGSSSTRTQAQREYERSFERERRGVDG